MAYPNGCEWNELPDFVAADVVRNGLALGVDGYRAMLEENYRDIPTLYFIADLLVADERRLASAYGSTAGLWTSSSAGQSTNGTSFS
ncbi:ester cyclase [Oryzifoliimicrobium ureilyticus]|uniref:ester cyclase n=1 Tax=Oryzifoliimicrobium ureilyticus TaxID=3113724 RepID=UPI003F6801DD